MRRDLDATDVRRVSIGVKVLGSMLQMEQKNVSLSTTKFPCYFEQNETEVVFYLIPGRIPCFIDEPTYVSVKMYVCEASKIPLVFH